MKKIKLLWTLFLILASLDLWSMAAWNSRNDPKIINDETTDYQFEYNFFKLPAKGSLDFKPWTDSYWPNKKRGTAYRWNKKVTRKYIPLMPSKDRVLKLNLTQMKKLSPAEKYDISQGRYDYPLTKKERRRTSYLSSSWHGICHGWAPASFLFEEPSPMVYESVDGIQVPFGSSDVKALLSLLQGVHNKGRTYFAGTRCSKRRIIIRRWRVNDPCMDLNPGSFHVIMANRLGILKKPFIIDIVPTNQVWNHPVHGFSSEVIKKQAPSYGHAPGTVKELLVKTVIDYTDEISPNYSPQNKEEIEKFRKQKTYRYYLELDKNNNIIGGKWKSKKFPDFLWIQEKATFSNYFEGLEDIYLQSIN